MGGSGWRPSSPLRGLSPWRVLERADASGHADSIRNHLYSRVGPWYLLRRRLRACLWCTWRLGFYPGCFRRLRRSGHTGACGQRAVPQKMPIPEQVFVAQTALSRPLACSSFWPLLRGSRSASWAARTLDVGSAAAHRRVMADLGLWHISSLNVFFRDVVQLLAIVFQVWMWSLPVVYQMRELCARPSMAHE